MILILKPKIDNKAIVNMMVDQVIKDMESFKDDKSALLKEIDSKQFVKRHD